MNMEQVILQEYEGRSNCDVTIFPWRDHVGVAHAFVNFIENNTREEIEDMSAASERNTWSRMPQVSE
jgi:hypothetical protein